MGTSLFALILGERHLEEGEGGTLSLVVRREWDDKRKRGRPLTHSAGAWGVGRTRRNNKSANWIPADEDRPVTVNLGCGRAGPCRNTPRECRGPCPRKLRWETWRMDDVGDQPLANLE